MLHGKVLVNEFEIVNYQIENMGVSAVDSHQFDYTFTIWGRDDRGYPYSYVWESMHRTTAPGLVAIAMTEIHKRLTGKELTGWGVTNDQGD
jgi:hypothetical protein